MKKYLTAILMMGLTIGALSGCGGDAAEEDTAAENTDETTPVVEEAAPETEASFDAAYFPTWFEEEGNWRTVMNAVDGNPTGFVEDESGKPTDEDLEKMLHMSSLAVTSGGKTDWFMVAVTDPEEQAAIIGENEDGVPKSTSDGTVTVLVFTERALREDVRTNDISPFTPDRGYYDAGIVTGYLNTAAISLGYGTHMFMTPALEGENGFNDGDIGLEATKYLEGTEYTDGSTGESFSNENMKFVNAVVIGTPDTTVEGGVTEKEFPDNWIVWEE